MSWFVWANVANPEPVTYKVGPKTIEQGEFWRTTIKLRESATIRITLAEVPNSKTYFSLYRDGYPISMNQVINEDQSLSKQSHRLTTTLYNTTIPSTGDWIISLWCNNSQGDSINFNYTYNNPTFSATQQYKIMFVLMLIIILLDVTMHWTALRHFRLWIKAKLSGREVPSHQDIDMKFGHEDMIESDDDKISSVFGDKKKEK